MTLVKDNLFIYFLKLGMLKFGGPLVLVDSMKTDLVGDGKKFSESDYKMGLALSQIAPGPLATQLAAYFGWLHGGFWGALGVTVVLILPSFLMVCLIAEIYLGIQNNSILRQLSYAGAPAVIGLMFKSAVGLFRNSDLKKLSHILILLASFLTTIIYKQEVLWVFVIAALLPTLSKNKLWAGTPIITGLNWDELWRLWTYFLEVGAVVFGSGLVIVPLMYGGVVLEHKWLTETQFIDAIAIGMMTPGPVVITVAFIGYLVGGFSGATASALGIFLPCFLFVVLPAPYFGKWLKKRPDLYSSVEGLSIAALGAIFGGAVLLIQKNLNDPLQWAMALVSLAIALRVRILDPILIVFIIGATHLIKTIL